MSVRTGGVMSCSDLTAEALTEGAAIRSAHPLISCLFPACVLIVDPGASGTLGSYQHPRCAAQTGGWHPALAT